MSDANSTAEEPAIKTLSLNFAGLRAKLHNQC